jgi:hypothetical protein
MTSPSGWFLKLSAKWQVSAPDVFWADLRHFPHELPESGTAVIP